VEGSQDLTGEGGKVRIQEGDNKGKEGLLESVPVRGGWEQDVDGGEIYDAQN